MTPSSPAPRSGGTSPPQALDRAGILNLSGRGMLVVSVARQLGSANSVARPLCCPAQAERGGERRLGSVKLTMPDQPLRQRTSLNPDPTQGHAERGQKGDDIGRLGRYFLL